MAQSLERIWTHLIFSTKERFPFLTDQRIRQICTPIWQPCSETMVARH